MNNNSIRSNLFLYFLVLCFPVINAALTGNFPDPLTSANFDEELKSGLHIVEFYSPYCSHCRDLAPIWKETWEQFQTNPVNHKVKFSQVNCVESGDICSQENIRAYPTIRLYGPNGLIKEYPANYERTSDAFIKFATEETVADINTNIDLNPNFQLSKDSLQLNIENLTDFLAGEAKIPYFISFWPSESSYEDSQKPSDLCEDCEPFKKRWEILSEQLFQNRIQSAHFNCQDSLDICKLLGFPDLTNSTIQKSPSLILLLPNRKTNNIYTFMNSLYSTDSLILDFATRTAFNAELNDITKESLEEIINKNLAFPELTSKQKIYLVFSYDQNTIFDEDFVVLEYLIEALNNYEDIFLYKCKDDLTQLISKSYHRFYELINYNSSETKNYRSDYINLYLMSRSPTFYIFREGDLIPSVFNAYSTSESRSPGYITSWLDQTSLKKFTEVTSTKFPQLLNYANDIYESMAIQLIDLSSKELVEESNRYLKNYEMALYDYENTKIGYLMDLLEDKRKKKAAKVSKLKEKKTDSKSILKFQLQQLEYNYNKRVLPAYLDISKNLAVLEQYGMEIPDKKFQIGDMILIDKQKNKFYLNNIFDFSLRESSVYELRETFTSVTIPEVSKHEMKHVRSGKLINHSLQSNFQEYYTVFANFPILIFLLIIFIVCFRKTIRYRIGKFIRSSDNETLPSHGSPSSKSA